MAGVAQGKLSRRLRKRIRQMKQAEQDTAVWRTGHAADRANIQQQTVLSNWRGRSSTWKIKEEALRMNEVDKTIGGGHRLK